jgi:hypothetical protein
MIGPRIAEAWAQAAGDLAGDSRLVSIRGGVAAVAELHRRLPDIAFTPVRRAA